jgi:hypothetical protein
MKYLLLLFHEKTAIDLTPEEEQEYLDFRDDARARLDGVSGEALQPARTASVVRVRDGKAMVTDGPFIETKEQLGGFFLLDCPDFETALEMAAKCPTSWTGSVEVRAVQEVG